METDEWVTPFTDHPWCLLRELPADRTVGNFPVESPAHVRSVSACCGAPARRDGLVALVSIGTFVPLLWVTTPVLGFADYPLAGPPFMAGVLLLSGGLWLLQRTHVDLGTNWSSTPELRETHELVERGIYSRVRHPMHGALLLYGLGQALVVSNWVAGPLFVVTFAVLVALRIAPEERMMRAKFGAAYEAYIRRTTRLVPGVWSRRQAAEQPPAAGGGW